MLIIIVIYVLKMNSLYHRDMYNFKNPVNSYWEHTKPQTYFKEKSLNSNIKSDIVVIGGGYTGLNCALQLSKKFGFDVSLVEAGKNIGFGSSARNGGFVCMGPSKLSIKQLINKYGLNETKQYYKKVLRILLQTSYKN